MASRPPRPVIRLQGVRHNNLKNFDLDLPTRQLIVVTGLSGSGKSSLAFDTLFAEGQRRYIETFSPYARQFFDRMDKPQVDRIEGIPPAVAVEQQNTVRTTRSTVGTMTEICDHMKLLWPHLAELHCRQCGALIQRDSPQRIWDQLRAGPDPDADRLVTFNLPLSDRLTLADSLALVAKQGYQRLLHHDHVLRLEDALPALEAAGPSLLTVVQDRVRTEPAQRSRFVEACEQAYHFGKGRLRLHRLAPNEPVDRGQPFSDRHHCAACDIDYREPSPPLFSFNHPLGACPACRGFGRIISINYQLALPDPSKSLADGVVKPWQTGQGQECQKDMMNFARKRKVPTTVPFHKLPRKWQDWVIHGDPGYGKDAAHQWPRAWYGVAGYFRWLESKAYKMHVRVLLSRYRAYSPCPDCQGRRFQPESLLYRVPFPGGASLSLAEYYQLPVRDARERTDQLAKRSHAAPNDPVTLVLNEVRSRLAYLETVGLGYLTLDRPTRTLSGGETERVNLTTCLGSRLVNTLFVLDEPSVGLHARDTHRLVRILQALRDAGNTVVVVEHEANVMRAADQIVDLGPGQGEAGGQVMFQGTCEDLLQSDASLTARYLSGREQAFIPAQRPVHARSPRLTLAGACLHNLKDLTVEFPLNRLVCLTGVSGSGKSTLARELLVPALAEQLRCRPAPAEEGDAAEANVDRDDDPAETPDLPGSVRLTGHEPLSRVVLVDQSPLGRTPRSNPAVYVGAFDDLRELYAQQDLAAQRGMTASTFSFNSSQGQCEHCRGAGFEKIEMQFLSDVQIRCPECNGRRYRPHVLEILLPVAATRRPDASQGGAWSIADLLEATADEAMQALVPYARHPAGARALQRLRHLQSVGLGYLRLGQPINTLSGGESQRLKLAAHLAEHEAAAAPTRSRARRAASRSPSHTLFVFDEPTTGLHFHDVRVLLEAFQSLVEAGHSLLVIEHNLDVIRSADWVIDLGPEGGDEGGRLLVAGPPGTVAACPHSHTGAALLDAQTVMTLS